MRIEYSHFYRLQFQSKENICSISPIWPSFSFCHAQLGPKEYGRSSEAMLIGHSDPITNVPTFYTHPSLVLCSSPAEASGTLLVYA